MKVWLNTAILDEIREAASWGVLRGVTTDPAHIASAGVTDLRAHILEIIQIVQGACQCGSGQHGLVRHGTRSREIARWSPHVVIKIPTIIEGLKAMKVVKEFATINATLIFSPNQAYYGGNSGRALRLAVRQSAGRHWS